MNYETSPLRKSNVPMGLGNRRFVNVQGSQISGAADETSGSILAAIAIGTIASVASIGLLGWIAEKNASNLKGLGSGARSESVARRAKVKPTKFILNWMVDNLNLDDEEASMIIDKYFYARGDWTEFQHDMVEHPPFLIDYSKQDIRDLHNLMRRYFG